MKFHYDYANGGALIGGPFVSVNWILNVVTGRISRRRMK